MSVVRALLRALRTWLIWVLCFLRGLPGRLSGGSGPCVKPGTPGSFTSDDPVTPEAGHWVPVLPLDPLQFRVEPPPGNASATTREELDELRQITRLRTGADILQIRRWSTYELSTVANWEALANQLAFRYDLSPPEAARVHYLMNAAIYVALVATWAAKYCYLRPRPDALDPEVDVSVIQVPQHPAYPSGHSTTAGAASAIIGSIFPDAAEVADALAEDSGISRLKAGIHYRSDHVAGLTLGREVAAAVLACLARDGGPLEYPIPQGVRPISLEEFLAILDCQNIRCQTGE